ncbi:sigma-70 family RNA polymerase sigma factor [Candidatus Gracilibacteria bacterium]|nr:sigma-70 family RNA polymerase sigma factor [Candidatus Gracilibacteria bacterium]
MILFVYSIMKKKHMILGEGEEVETTTGNNSPNQGTNQIESTETKEALKGITGVQRKNILKVLELSIETEDIEVINIDTPPTIPSPEEYLQSKQGFELIEKYMQRLPLRTQEIMKLYYGVGMTLQEIANAYKISSKRVADIRDKGTREIENIMVRTGNDFKYIF